ncbi:MAG: zinc-ribbon domain-containing protein, partial [Acidobacteriota bacterium]
GARFCGRCGNTTFAAIEQEGEIHHTPTPPGPSSLNQPSLNQPSLGGAPGRIRCTRCGMDQPAGTKFCGRCGASLGGAPIAWTAPRSVEVICPQCRTSYPPGTRFCGRCGRTL